MQFSVEVLRFKFETSAPLQIVSNHIAVNTYYLQVSGHDMNSKHILGIIFEVGQ